MDRLAQSPCIRNCCLDDEDTCLGCFRSLEEIKEWGLIDDARRQLILSNAEQRKDAHQKLHGNWLDGVPASAAERPAAPRYAIKPARR